MKALINPNLKNKIQEYNKKYAIYIAVELPKKFILRRMVFTKTKHQRGSKVPEIYLI